MKSRSSASHLQVAATPQVRGTFYILGWIGHSRRRGDRPGRKRNRVRSAPSWRRSKRPVTRAAASGRGSKNRLLAKGFRKSEREIKMGGTNSGRYRERNRGTVDAAFRLDIRALRRMGFLKPGAVTSGTLRWTYTATGQERGSMGVTVNLADPRAGFVVARFNLNDEPRVQEIQLASFPMRYGGRRYYFRCPKHGRCCEVMPMVGGVFASRQAQRMTYQSQSEDYLGRLRDKARRLEKRLWPDKGKRRVRGRNREQLVEAWIEADAAFENMFAATVMRRWGRLF